MLKFTIGCAAVAVIFFLFGVLFARRNRRRVERTVTVVKTNKVWRSIKQVVAPEKDKSGKERSSDYYDEMYLLNEEYKKHYTQSHYYFIWCVLGERIKPTAGNFIFDVGCGPGQLASFLKDRGLGRYVGLDFSQRTIQMAKSVCPGFEFVRADAFQTDLFQTLPYDIFLTTEFLEHVENDLDILKKVRSGTRVYATVPNFADPGHVRFFKNADEVKARYGHLFQTIKVDVYLENNVSGLSYFLFEGIRA
jgi:SAM-dependent methyltransferase